MSLVWQLSYSMIIATNDWKLVQEILIRFPKAILSTSFYFSCVSFRYYMSITDWSLWNKYWFLYNFNIFLIEVCRDSRKILWNKRSKVTFRCRMLYSIFAYLLFIHVILSNKYDLRIKDEIAKNIYFVPIFLSNQISSV